MNNTAQQAFQDFQDNQLSSTYNWDSFTDEQRKQEMELYTKLKIEAAKEIKQNQVETNLLNEQERINNRILMINTIVANGYQCDNSLEDWKKLYNHPEIFGENWENKAEIEQSISSGIDYFITEYIKNNN